MLSREALFLLNNLLFMSILVVCFWGVIFPLDLRTHHRPEGDRRAALLQSGHGPLFATLMLLMGIAPLSAWGHSTVRTLGRALWKSALAALLITAGIFATYTRTRSP